MRVFTSLLSVFVLIGFSATGWAGSDARNTATSAADDMSRVSEVRRLLRSACGGLKIAGTNPENADTILENASNETSQALTLWREFRQQHSNRPPIAYAAHESWDRAAQDIEEGIQEMLRQAIAKQSATAFQACGRTCGKFVEMNEKAGVRRTSDILFHFRKAAKPLAELAQSGAASQLKETLPRLLELRDRALADPIGGTGTPEQKRRALVSFSAAVDAFAESVDQEDTGKMTSQYDTMMKAMEHAYDLFL